MKKIMLSAAVAALCVTGAQAADWSDTSMSLSQGNAYREPVNSQKITKSIVSLTHVSGDKYGTNFFNADLLNSNSNDSQAQETYVVYRRLFDFGKINNAKYEFGPVRGLGLTTGFDWNTKNDPGYGSRKRMFVVGPTAMFNVPGFLNVSLLVLDESNDPSTSSYTGARYHYKNHADLSVAWGIPVAEKVEFAGWADFIAPKGADEFGSQTAGEQHIYSTLMFDVSNTVGASKNTWKLGVGYEYWKNKFGNDNSNPYYKGGAFAQTPFIKAEYHF